MNARYDPDQLRRFYDAYGEREWERLEANASGRVGFHIHRSFLQRYVQPGDHVLEAGAGPGRFTIELARLGAKVTVGDISPVQLGLNRQKVREAGCEQAVVAREVLDILDLSRFPAHCFDAVVCYGGPLSYVFDRVDDAMKELLRVIKPGGHLLVSVMSLLGSIQKLLPGVLQDVEQYGLATVQQLMETGDHHGEMAAGHDCHLYRWTEFKEVLQRHQCQIVAASAANFLSVANDDVLEETINHPATWEAFLRWEVEFSAEPAAIDGGTHIIAVLRRT